MTCRCTGIRHALDAGDRQHTRRALELARTEGKPSLAAHHQARLDQCPTTILTVQERTA